MLVHLVADSLRLIVVASSHSADWASLVLSWEGSAVRLGSEKTRRILDHLRLGLDSESMGSTVDEIDGEPVAAVLVLAEMHGRIYAATSTEGVTWYFQDAEGRSLGKVELTALQRALWMEILDANL